MAGLQPYLCVFMLALAVHGASAWPIVQFDDRGTNVVVVQDLLQARNYSLASDGKFGPITRAAVKAFQVRNALPSHGMVSPMTWPVLIVTVQFGSRGRAVRAVQYLLAYRYYRLAVTGIDSIFGPITRGAVKSFQASRRLEQDGIVGPLTWEALVSGGN